MFDVVVIPKNQVDHSLLEQFAKDHWGTESESEEEVRANFFAPIDFAITAQIKSKLVGYLNIHLKPQIMIGDTTASCGGIGGVITHTEYRHRGIATQILKQAMMLMRQEKLDISMLCTEIAKLGHLYAPVGFTPLHKPYYFTDKYGVEKIDNDGMIANVSNPAIYHLAITPNTKIHVGASNF